jgi:hypothetical protein
LKNGTDLEVGSATKAQRERNKGATKAENRKQKWEGSRERRVGSLTLINLD